MLLSDIPKSWRHTAPGVWHQPRKELKWANRQRDRKKLYSVWAIYYEKICARCGKKCVLPQRWRKYCTMNCANQAIKKWGKDHPRWKGGRAKIASGYVLIRVGYKKYKFEHVLKMENKIGRKMCHNEVVHHRNGVKNDNRLCNLQLMTKAEHLRHHRPGDGNKKAKHQ